MPAKTGKQYRLMQAAAHGASDKVPEGVAKEFIKKTPKTLRERFMKKKTK